MVVACEATAGRGDGAESLAALPLEELIRRWNRLFWWTTIRPIFRRMVAADLTLAESIVLRGLQRRPLTIAEAAECLCVSHSAASRAADRLVRDGLVARQERAEDRRQKHLTLTPRGAALLGEMEAMIAGRFGQAIAALRPDEQEQLRLLLARLIATYPVTIGAGEGDGEDDGPCPRAGAGRQEP